RLSDRARRQGPRAGRAGCRAAAVRRCAAHAQRGRRAASVRRPASGRRVMITFSNPDTAPAPASPLYSNAGTVDLGAATLIVLSGQIAVNSDGELVGGDDMAAQSEQVFRNIGALLSAHSTGFYDVINIRSYLTDL